MPHIDTSAHGQAYELVKLALKNDMRSHVCWHVYGLLHRCSPHPPSLLTSADVRSTRPAKPVSHHVPGAARTMTTSKRSRATSRLFALTMTTCRFSGTSHSSRSPLACPSPALAPSTKAGSHGALPAPPAAPAATQVQMRDYKGFIETRRHLLDLKSNNKGNWMAFAISNQVRA